MRDACCKFLLSQLDPSNCLGIRGFADTHSCSDLLKSAHKYVLQHFVEVSKTEEFMLLPLKQVRSCWEREGVAVARLFVLCPGRHSVCVESPRDLQRGTGFGRGVYPDSVPWSSLFSEETICGKKCCQ